jgi:hypothetical protein
VTTAAATLLLLLIIAALVAVAAIVAVVVVLGATASVTTALAALVEWRQKQRPERADPHRRGFLAGWASRRPALRWAVVKVAEVEGRDAAPIEEESLF